LAMQHAVMLLTVKNRQQMVHSPLRREVQELSLTVQSQEVLLTALARSGRFRSGVAQWRDKRRSLQSVQEQQEQARPGHDHRGEEPRPTEEPQIVVVTAARESSGDLSSGSLSDLRPISERPNDELGRLLLRSLPPNFQPSISSRSTDRTVSDRSAGLLTPNSNTVDTPPPSILGRQSQSRRGRRLGIDPLSSARGSGGDLGADVATQLLTVLQAQHQLWTTLQSATPTSGSVGSRTPDTLVHHPRTPDTPLQHQAPELQRLQAALQLMHPAAPSPPQATAEQMTMRAI